jgi:hypothetical protein
MFLELSDERDAKDKEEPPFTMVLARIAIS